MKKVLLFLGLCNLVFGAESEISAVDTLFLIACSGFADDTCTWNVLWWNGASW